MKIEFEHNYQLKVMMQTFTEEFHLETKADVMAWRGQWMDALKTWHSPYKALINVENLKIAQTEEVKDALATMEKFFKGFFLKSAVAYPCRKEAGHEILPFIQMDNEEDALTKVGLNRSSLPKKGDFRSAIQLQNHFRQHVVELNFAEPVVVDSKEKLDILKSKLTNNLMQWHSKWSLLIDCANLEVSADISEQWQIMERFFRGFFMKNIIGYSPKASKEDYPFQVFRARHRAAAQLESEGNFSGDDADCISRKTPVSDP